MIPVYNIYIVKTILCKHKLHILEILACGTKRRLKNGSASLCHYQRNEFYIFEFVAACGPRQTHFHTEAQTDSRDWRNPLRQNLTVLPAPPKGGAFGGSEGSGLLHKVSILALSVIAARCQIPPFVAARHLPPAGGSLSSQGELLSYVTIRWMKPRPSGEVDLRSKDREGHKINFSTASATPSWSLSAAVT